MRLSFVAILMLVFGLVGFETVGIAPAPGQALPQAQPPATPVPTTAVAPVSGYYAPAQNTAFGQMFAPTLDRPSSKEQELDRQSHDLARQYGKAENRDEREKLKDKLNDALKQQFDAQQQHRKDQIKQIEDQLKKLRDLMQKREESKSSIVQRRLEQLLQEAEGLGWTSSESSPFLPRVPQTTPSPAAIPAPGQNPIRREQ